MIITLLLNLSYALVTGLLALLPTGGTFPEEWTEGIYTLWQGINAFSFIVPVEMFVTCLAIALAWDLFVFAWHLLHWLLRKIPVLHIR